MNLLNYNHSISSLFILSGRLYKKNIIPILILTSVLIAPAFLIGFAGWKGAAIIVLSLSIYVLEGAITLGVIGLTFGSYFPALGILRAFRSPLFLGTIHVAVLQLLLLTTGFIMVQMLPFPFSVLVAVLWLGGLLLTSIAQPVFIVEGLRGMRAMTRSIQLALSDMSRVFVVVVVSNILLISVFALLLYLFIPEWTLMKFLELNRIENPEILNKSILLFYSEILSDPDIHQAIRWTQYLSSLLFYPFASLLTCLLYFDLAQRQQVLNEDQLAKFSNQLFGTPLTGTAESASPADEEVIEPTDVEILDPDPSEEDKDK